MGQRRALIVVAVLAARVASADPDPTAIVIVLDRSSAMEGERLELAKLAVLDLVESLPAADRVAIVGYAKRASVVAAMGAPSRDRIAKALDGLVSDGAAANLESGLELAATLFTDPRLERQVIVATASNDIRPEAARGRARLVARDASISTIAIQLDSHARLDRLEARGGSYAVGDLIDLPRVLRGCVRAPARTRDVALAILIDRSGSMIESHRLEIAKQVASQLVAQLDPRDLVSVIAFDSEALTLIPPTRGANRARIANELARLDTGGGTNAFPALREAQVELAGIDAGVKQVVVITDGMQPTDGILELVAELRASHVMVSAVGVPGADRAFLSDLATAGSGELYMIEDSPEVRLFTPPTAP